MPNKAYFTKGKKKNQWHTIKLGASPLTVQHSIRNLNDLCVFRIQNSRSSLYH